MEERIVALLEDLITKTEVSNIISMQIKEQLEITNIHLETIRGDGIFYSITDIYHEIEKLIDAVRELKDIQGFGTYNQISDVCNKLDNIESAIERNSF